MRWNGFVRSLVFAAVTALAYVPYSALISPWLGAKLALSSYLILAVSVYVTGLASTLRRGLGAALVAAPLGLGLLLISGSPQLCAVGAVFILGLCRSGVLYRSRFGRALVLESVLGFGGLLLADFLWVGSFFPVSMALWGFFLVQSAFFLIGGVSERRDVIDDMDPFDQACTRALALLEE